MNVSFVMDVVLCDYIVSFSGAGVIDGEYQASVKGYI